MAYLRLISQRLVMTILTLWGLATLVFLMIKLIPGDEAQVAAGPGASPEQVAAVADVQPLTLSTAASPRRQSLRTPGLYVRKTRSGLA